jgi:hypothetical protein
MPEEEPKAPLTGEAKKKKQRVIGYAALAVGVVGALIAWLAYRNSKSSSSTTSSTGTTSTTGTTSATGTTGSGTVAGYTSDGSQSSYDQEIVQALSALSSSVGTATSEMTAAEQSLTSGTTAATTTAAAAPAVTTTTPTPPLYTDTSSEQYLGVGYNAPGYGTAAGAQPVTTSAGTFNWLPSAQAASAYQQTGGQEYYQPQKGQFQPITYQQWTQLPGQTALFSSS